MDFVLPSGVRVLGSETITVDNTAGGKSLTAATYTEQYSANYAGAVETARFALLTLESNPIRWKVDPAVTVEAAANGHTMAVTDHLWLQSPEQIRNFRAIRTGGSSGTLFVTYFA